MKYLLKRALLALPGFQSLCRLVTRRHVRVLMYHRFGPDGIDTDTLTWQMAAIRAHHACWPVARHHEVVAGALSFAEWCPVVVTIDDGYRDFGEIGWPVFRKYDVPVLVFVTSGFIDGQLWLWWDRLKFVFENAAPVNLSVEHAGERHRIDLSSPADRLATWHRIGSRCCFLPEDVKVSLIATLAECLAVEIPTTPPQRYSPLTWDELRDLHGQGVSLGAHTVNHPILTRVPLETARQEIRVSKRRLEEELGETVPWFCFPQGGPADYSPELVEEIDAAGFSLAYLAFHAPSRKTMRFTLPRYSVPADRTEFHWVLCGAAYLDLYLSHRLGRDTGLGEVYWSGAEKDATSAVTSSTSGTPSGAHRPATDSGGPGA